MKALHISTEGLEVSALGLGCMGMSSAYEGRPTSIKFFYQVNLKTWLADMDYPRVIFLCCLL